MAKSITLLRIFVAGPSDVDEERAIVGEAVGELNVGLVDSLGIQLSLVEERTDVPPDMGSDAQDVINRAIADDDYDIFVGIMWTRIGTPTPRSGSGTEEEFERAYDRWQESPDSLKVMFYFKDAQLPPSKIDPEQLGAVSAFRKRLGEKGLYKMYKNSEEFAKLLRIHLTKQANEWGQTWGDADRERVADTGSEPMTRSISAVRTRELDELVEDEGLMDLLEQVGPNTEEFTQSADRMTSIIGEFAARIGARTVEMHKAAESDSPEAMKTIKAITNRSAEDFGEFAAQIQAEMPIMSRRYSRLTDIVVRGASILPDFGDEHRDEIGSLYDAIKESRVALIEARDSVLELREAAAALPRITTALNRGKRKLVAALDACADELSTLSNLGEEAESLLAGILEG